MNTNKRIPDDFRMAITALALTATVAVVLAVVASYWLGSSFPAPEEASELKVKYLEQYIEVAQVIVVGVFVTLVSVIIQFMLPEARDRFERYKESRQAYSRAKTAALYLPDRVANSDSAKAFVLVEEAHRELHFAETFADVIISKGYLDWFANPELWILYNYWQIAAVAKVLRSDKAFENKDELRRRLDETVGVVHDRFGKRGEHCVRQKWVWDPQKDAKPNVMDRFDEEDKLCKKIKKAADSRSMK